MAFSVFVTLVGAEIAYRGKLFLHVGHVPLGMSTSYIIFNKSYASPDEAAGKTRRPNGHIVILRVSDGKPVLFYERFTNELGNYEPPKPHYKDADLKVLVFGDSYTAMFGDGTVWPTLLEQRLQKRLNKNVCVLNFGHHGAGVLEMFDAARVKVPEFQPDLVLICFISDDLNRARPSGKPTKREVRLGFSDEAVTKDWCQTVLRSGGTDDPILQKYNRQFEESKAKASRINYFTPVASFLYNRLVWDDPFRHQPGKSSSHRVEVSDFSSDPSFLSALATLNETNVPFHLIHLPDHREITAGSYRLTIQQKALLKSLKKTTDHDVIGLLDEAKSIEHPDDLFLVPHDPHPSGEGLKFYARAVEETLEHRERMEQ